MITRSQDSNRVRFNDYNPNTLPIQQYKLRLLMEVINLGCIYMYTNKINGKKYIGQTTCSLKRRHAQHVCQNETYFDRALNKYGAENFELEVIEDNIFDENELNDKEIYYINKFDTFNNGYNMTRGGDNGTKFNEEDWNKIVDLIKNTSMSFKEIGEKTGYTIYTISSINQGETFPSENETYPIRTQRSTQKFSQDDIEMVVELLITTDFSFDKISEITNTNWYFVSDVNRGKRKFASYGEIQFPIRKNNKHTKITDELVSSIVSELQRDELSEEQIGEFLNISPYTVGQINRGKHSICKSMNISFPIRQKQHRNKTNYSGRKINDNQLLEIIDLLLNTSLSTEEIARRYNVDKSAINRINRGVVFKPITNQYKLPIRQNKQDNLQRVVA